MVHIVEHDMRSFLQMSRYPNVPSRPLSFASNSQIEAKVSKHHSITLSRLGMPLALVFCAVFLLWNGACTTTLLGSHGSNMERSDAFVDEWLPEVCSREFKEYLSGCKGRHILQIQNTTYHGMGVTEYGLSSSGMLESWWFADGFRRQSPPASKVFSIKNKRAIDAFGRLFELGVRWQGRRVRAEHRPGTHEDFSLLVFIDGANVTVFPDQDEGEAWLARCTGEWDDELAYDRPFTNTDFLVDCLSENLFGSPDHMLSEALFRLDVVCQVIAAWEAQGPGTHDMRAQERK